MKRIALFLWLLTLGQIAGPPKMPTPREFRINQGLLVVLRFDDIKPYLVPLANGKRTISIETLAYLKGKK